MTDTKPNNPIKQPATKPAVSSNASSSTNTKKTKAMPTGRKVLIWLLLILAIAASIVFYQNWQLKQTLNQFTVQQLSVTENQVTQADLIQSLQQQQTDLQQALTQQSQALSAQESAVDTALEQAMQQLAQQQRQSHQQSPKLALAEAEYLLRLANQRLGIEQKPANVIPLLQAADEIIRTSKQIGSFAVRKAIAKDLMALKNVTHIDNEGIYAQLTGLVSLTNELRYVAPTAATPSTVLLSDTNATASNNTAEPQEDMLWNQLQQGVIAVASGTWQELKDLIRIQQRHSADQALLTPQAERLVRMRLQLILNQSQTALLQEQADIYQNALSQVQAILTQYYRPSDTVTRSMLNTISELQAMDTKPVMPSIHASLETLQALQAAVNKQGE